MSTAQSLYPLDVTNKGIAGDADKSLTSGFGAEKTIGVEMQKCPRCGGTSPERFYGPCSACREALRAKFAKAEPPASALVLTRRRVAKIVARRQVFTVDHGAGVGDMLDGLADDVRRVQLVGPRPGGDLDGFQRWRSATGSWAAAPAGHYLESLMLPVLRYVNGDRQVDVQRAAAWFGEGDYSPADCEAAMGLVGELVAERFDGRPALLATPASTGRDLFLRSIPDGVAWPVLPDELQELIRSTSGQGRIELRPVADPMPGLVELDGRFMYAALCRELPAGEPQHHQGEPPGGVDPYARARYRVRWLVPRDWGHVGLLPMHDPDGGWCWPAEPGTAGRGWVDGAELHLAARWGWDLQVHESIVWPAKAGDPLGPWAKQLIAVRDHVGLLDVTPAVRELAEAAVRSILLHGIGAFHGRPHMVTRSCSIDDAATVPEGAAGLRAEGDQLVWGERLPQRWPELAHPEWSAAVWARCRARMLDGPGPGGVRTGALHVDPAAVLAIRTDALYLTADPGWPDGRQAGHLRRKMALRGPLRAPSSVVELLAHKADDGAAAASMVGDPGGVAA